MDLYIVRHGKAETWDPNHDDFNRELTIDGRLGVEAAARAMIRLEVKIDQLISSPLIRAMQTAQIFADAFTPLKVEVNDKLSGGTDSDQIIRMLQKIGKNNSIAIFGHNPDFSYLVSALTVSSPTAFANIQLKVGSVVRVEFPAINSWSELEPCIGVLRWILEPKILRELGG